MKGKLHTARWLLTVSQVERHALRWKSTKLWLSLLDFAVNYILGVGVLGIPYAFVETGYILAPILMFVATVSPFPCNYTKFSTPLIVRYSLWSLHYGFLMSVL